MVKSRRDDAGGARRRERRLAMLRGAVADGSMLRLGDAARLLGVSEMTVRRDLAAGASQLACLGGYVFRAEASGTAPRYALDAENASHIILKQEAARRAAALVEPGDTVFIDCGTTMPHLAAALPAGPLTVICYALNIAELVCRRPDTQVVLLGGLYHPSSATFYGEETLAALGRLVIARAFISAGGVDFERGVSCSHFHEVPVKQATMSHARHSYLVADSSKFGQLRPAAFARLDAFERVFTDDGISPADRERLKAISRARRPRAAHSDSSAAPTSSEAAPAERARRSGAHARTVPVR
ncbi:MAG TPA: DeoR/GlpR family DNA-binding transcription regulator [Anaeromyxobacteraceae bacterium]|nr:DeoR/GlpR family DNA-binding transcription regulator [Anaeromyxobacteraceae bacterium]